MTIGKAVRGLMAIALVMTFFALPAPTSTYAETSTDNITVDQTPVADSNNQTTADNITAGEAPIADFTADPTSTFVDDDVTFTDVSAGNPTSWDWDFDNDGNTDSTEQNPVYQYSVAGTYTVTLTVTNDYGLDTKTKTDYIMVSEAPVPQTSEPAATTPPSKAAEPLATEEPTAIILSMSNASSPLAPDGPGSVTDLSRGGIGNPLTNWQACLTDDDDNSYVYSNISDNNPPYPTDLYDLTTFTPPASCNINSVTVYIRARASTTPTRASAYISIRNGSTGTIYSNSSTPFTLTTNYATYSYSWLTNPAGGNWTWAQIDALQAGPSLRRPAGRGTQSIVTAVWVVVDYGPTANFSASPTSGCAPVSVIFTDTSIGTPTSWSWSFSGGNPSTAVGQGPHTVIYDNAGSYDVSLTISNSCGSDTKTQIGYINVNPTPTISISGNPSICAGSSTVLTANVTGGSTPYTYLWYPGGATTQSVTVSTSDNYTVTVTDSLGCQGRAKTVVKVNPSLSVNLTGNPNFCEGSSTAITANVSGGTPPYTYNFGLGSAPGTWTSDNNTFIATGTGTVQVKVTDSARCRGVVISDTNTEVTQGNIPNVSYRYNAVLAWVHPNWWLAPPTGLNYRFGYPNNASQWIWESYRPIHPVDGDIVYFQRSFTIPGTPTGAVLYITCDNGYEVSINDHLIGSAQLLPGWGPGRLTNAYVTSGGWELVESWSVPADWLLNGNNTLNIIGVNEYSGPLDGGSPGTVDGNPGALIYELIYESQSDCGCSITSSPVTVTANPSPTANFSAIPLSGFAPLMVTFTDNSTGTITSRNWSFPGGSPSSASGPGPNQITYNSPGSYNVSLVVSNTYGCTDNETKLNYINVNPPPTAPTVSELQIYTDSDCNNPASSMSPLTTYYARARIDCNATPLSYLQQVQVILFYVSDNSSPAAPTGGDTQTCAILRCSVGTPPTWPYDFGSPPSPTTTWQLVTDNCSQPADLTTTWGYWKFAFIPGKVAHESLSPAHWDIRGAATNKATPPQTGEVYTIGKGMNWYGEITTPNLPSISWSPVPLGLKFSDAPNPKSLSITYIANGNYYENIRSENWTNGSETVLLDTTGNQPALPGRFALKANAVSDNSTWLTVTGGYGHMGSSGTITSEAGNPVTTNTLWLSLSDAGILPIPYGGNIYYQIAKR